MTLNIDPESEPGRFISQQNRARQFDFIHTSWVIAHYGVGLQIGHDFICDLNKYATHFISLQPGQYRRHYNVKVREHRPSDWPLVYEEMEQFIEVLYREWGKWDELQAYADLVGKLAELGVHDSEPNIRNKISRGKFTAVFFVQCLTSIGAVEIRL